MAVVSHAGGGSGRPCPFTVAWCERHGVEHAYFPRLRRRGGAGGVPARTTTPELLLSLSYDLILPEPLLALAPRAVNVHRGLAPDFRGAYSTIWALARDADAVGVTVHEMVGDVDAGEILAQARLPVTPELTAAEAIPLVERAAVELVDSVLDDLLADRLPRRAQSLGGEVFGRELPPAELVGVEPLVRARLNPPYPGPSVALGARRFAITEVPPADDGALEELTASPRFIPPAVWHNAREFSRVSMSSGPVPSRRRSRWRSTAPWRSLRAAGRGSRSPSVTWTVSSTTTTIRTRSNGPPTEGPSCWTGRAGGRRHRGPGGAPPATPGVWSRTGLVRCWTAIPSKATPRCSISRPGPAAARVPGWSTEVTLKATITPIAAREALTALMPPPPGCGWSAPPRGT